MRKEKFSIRKFTVGTASVLVGAALLAGGVNVDVNAASAEESNEVTSENDGGFVDQVLKVVKENANNELNKLSSLSENELATYKESVANAKDVAEVETILNEAVAKNAVNAEAEKEQKEALEAEQKAQELAEAKSAAIFEINAMDKFTDEERAEWVAAVEEQPTVERVDIVLGEAIKAHDNLPPKKDEVETLKYTVNIVIDDVETQTAKFEADSQEELDQQVLDFLAPFLEDGKLVYDHSDQTKADERTDYFSTKVEDVDYAAKLAETPFDTEEAAKEAAEDYLNDPTKNVKGHKGYEVKEFGGKYYVVLSFDENEAPEAPVEDEEDVEDVDYAEKLAGTAFDTEKEAIIAGYAYLQDKDKNKAGHTGFEVKEFGGKYYVILNFDGVAPALPVEPGETDKDVDYAEKLAGTAFDTEKDAILAGYDYLLNPDKNKAGHTGFSVQEFGGKYYVILNFDGVAPAVPLEPGKPGEDDKEDGKDPETKPGEGDKKPGEGDGKDDKKPGKEEGDKVAPGKDGKDGKDKKDGKKDGKKLPNTGEAQSGLLASAAALLGAAGLFLVGRRKKAEK